MFVTQKKLTIELSKVIDRVQCAMLRESNSNTDALLQLERRVRTLEAKHVWLCNQFDGLALKVECLVAKADKKQAKTTKRSAKNGK